MKSAYGLPHIHKIPQIEILIITYSFPAIVHCMAFVIGTVII